MVRGRVDCPTGVHVADEVVAVISFALNSVEEGRVDDISDDKLMTDVETTSYSSVVTALVITVSAPVQVHKNLTRLTAKCLTYR